jgi:transmembrane sensor
MKEMKKKDTYTDNDWEKLALLLSEEKSNDSDILKRFIADDSNNTGKQWKELKDMNSNKKINIDKAWNKVYSQIDIEGNATKKLPSGISLIYKIAAIAIILLSIGTAVIYINSSGILSKKITVVTGNDKINLHITLPDGSNISLNRNTELSYRRNFGKTGRAVKLEGEAFFEISPDASKPFTIDAGNANVKVTGTSFNVITRNIESAVEVFVKTGNVILTDNTGSKSLDLDPGFIGKMDSDISEIIINEDPNYMSWNTGLLKYNGQKLDIVFNDLKRVYNMDIVADDPVILDNMWTSPINNQPEETIIRLICTSFNLRYTLDGSVYHLTKKNR